MNRFTTISVIMIPMQFGLVMCAAGFLPELSMNQAKSLLQPNKTYCGIIAAIISSLILVGVSNLFLKSRCYGCIFNVLRKTIRYIYRLIELLLETFLYCVWAILGLTTIGFGDFLFWLGSTKKIAETLPEQNDSDDDQDKDKNQELV